jgi:hypothetical protein
MATEKQMTGAQYLAKCAKVAKRDGETLEQFVAQFADAYKALAAKVYGEV